jgi:uncharacterized protein
MAGNCLGEYFMIESNGGIYHCEKYLGDERYKLGNIMKDHLSNIKNSTQLYGLILDETEKLALLKDCPYFETCNGGCPHDRYLAEKYLSGYNSKCCGQRKLMSRSLNGCQSCLVKSKCDMVLPNCSSLF